MSMLGGVYGVVYGGVYGMLCVQGGGSCHLECGGDITEAAWILQGREAVAASNLQSTWLLAAAGTVSHFMCLMCYRQSGEGVRLD